MGEGRDWGQQEKRRGGGGRVKELTPFRGTALPWGREGQTGSLQGVSMSLLAPDPNTPTCQGTDVRVGGVLAQGPRQESHPDVRGQEWRMCTRGLSPNCPQETPPLARGFGAGSPSQSGGREIVLSRCSPKGEIMGALRGGLCRPRPRPQVSPGVQGRSREVIKKINK